MNLRIIYLATADARGHLMRAQLLVHALRNAGAQVTVLTTSVPGQRFLQQFDIEAQVLSEHYAVQFDDRQNMLRKATNRNVAHYLFLPGRMLRDIWQLQRLFRDADIVINDSFHPALIYMGMLPVWRRKVVHIYGTSLKVALLKNFEGMWSRPFARLFGWIVGRQLNAALACIEHDFACAIDDTHAPTLYRLPTPVALATPSSSETEDGAAVYLNPHFSDPALADALTAGLADASVSAHLVGEGYAGFGDWLAVDRLWASRAACAKLIVSAPGMAALSLALVYQKPILLILCDQPEQMANAGQATQLQLLHRIVTWRGDAADFQRQVTEATKQLCAAPVPNSDGSLGLERAQARIDAWVNRLLALKVDHTCQ
ncbi:MULTISPECIES: hypothetical protein [unclassified Serratia (in: enterobacteria)]|uniref:hypothetical protein n=1 Tax=unclassified Serratia (in: enterobacteria) TaxID=2647522 RepID=UPI00046917B7|nr:MULTISPECIES: hypothetical protein [unclassified Serratia (in: enterobacteria)]